MKEYTKEELYIMDAVDIYKLVLAGNIKRFPRGFWQQPEAKQNAAKCTKYLIEEILKYDDEMIKEKNCAYIYHKNKLRGMVDICFNGSPYEALNNAYPNKFKEWEFNSVPKNYWEDKDNGIKAVKWLIEEKLKLSDEELKEQLSYVLFESNGLGRVIHECFDYSPYKAINKTYPGKFKEWEFKNVPNGYWTNKENIIKATKWLIEEKLKLSDVELKKQLSGKLFKDNGLSGMITVAFNNSPFDAINTAYPNKYKEWEFNIVPRDYWENKDNRTKAIKWLIEEKLKLSDEEIKKQLSNKLFKDNGLLTMIKSYYDASPYKVINTLYPGRFKEWEFNQVPRGYWSNKENGIKATKWLIEEKLKLRDEELKLQVSRKLFKDNGLGGMLELCFSNSVYKAIDTLYPNKYKEWEFKKVSKCYWIDDKNRIKAIKWLIEEKLKLSDKELKEKLSIKLFKENGLGGMLDSYFNNSPYKAINIVYPNKFKKSDFKGYIINNKA